MIDLDDPRWKSLRGPHGTPYDPRPALARIRSDDASSEPWYELMNELQDGSDLGDVAYAATVGLVDIAMSGRDLGPYFFGLVASTEVGRHRKTSPPLPGWLEREYYTAWKHLPELALQVLRRPPNPGTFMVAMAVVALAQRQLRLGALLLNVDRPAMGNILEEECGWKGLYREEEE